MSIYLFPPISSGGAIDISAIQADVGLIQEDVAINKANVALIKADVALIKADVATTKANVALIKTSMDNLVTVISDRLQGNIINFKYDTAQLSQTSVEDIWTYKLLGVTQGVVTTTYTDSSKSTVLNYVRS